MLKHAAPSSAPAQNPARALPARAASIASSVPAIAHSVASAKSRATIPV
nr:hypothetical protein [Acidocella sp. C78]